MSNTINASDRRVQEGFETLVEYLILYMASLLLSHGGHHGEAMSSVPILMVVR
jgi:hypothetical protein